MAIYITGDTHGSIDIGKLTTSVWEHQKKLTKNDYLIICGDCGIVWENSPKDYFWQKWYNDKPFTTLFLDGNHENHEALNNLPVEEKFGGNVHKIADSVFHLMRGEIYNIDNQKIFVMGGAESTDKEHRKNRISWWEEELPSAAEYDNALANLEKNNWAVDIILTHCAPTNISAKISKYDLPNQLTDFLQLISEKVKYKKWYFGHYHIDDIINNKMTAIYNSIDCIDMPL